MSRLVPAPDALVGKRFDVAVAKMLGISRAKAADLIESGQARVLGRDISKSSTLQAGETVEFDIVEERSEPEPIAHDMAVVYEDDDVVVVDKPVGVAAHPSLGWDGPSVTEHLAASGVQVSTSGAAERQGVVQRLDVGTSGLMVVAKSEIAYSVLKQAFRDRRVDKVYHALAQGHPDPFQGTIEAPIGRHPGSDWKMAIVEGGRHSVTHYETLEAHRAATLLEVHLETGRTHQIRVHLAAIGHPLVGDPLYGCDPRLAARLGLERQWLHAVELGFVHPTRGEYVQFTSEYPDDLARALDLVRAD